MSSPRKSWAPITASIDPAFAIAVGHLSTETDACVAKWRQSDDSHPKPHRAAESTPHGPDPEPYLEQIRKYADAGFTHVYIHQIGANQDEFLEFAARELLPKV